MPLTPGALLCLGIKIGLFPLREDMLVLAEVMAKVIVQDL